MILDELAKLGKVLFGGVLRYELRNCCPLKSRILRTAVGGGKVVQVGSNIRQNVEANSVIADGLSRLKTVANGVEIFTKLAANGIFPGYGGYEETDEGKRYTSNVTGPLSDNSSLTDTSGLSAAERNYLIKAAKEIGVIIPRIPRKDEAPRDSVKHVHDFHRPVIPKDYKLDAASLPESVAMTLSKERRVPSTRLARLANFGTLAMGLGTGAAAEVTRRTFGLTKSAYWRLNAPPLRVKPKPKIHDQSAINGLSNNPFLTTANVERIVATLCRVRGAALKIGQMLSIQDEELMPAYLLEIFERVRQSADFMPVYQVRQQMARNLGANWRERFQTFDEKPFAAASIGQVHKATLCDGRKLAVKIQYPGVADSIDSDINNLVSVLNFGRILPKGVFMENFVVVARRELKDECDYEREARAMRKFRQLLVDLPDFYVPEVIAELSTSEVLITELVAGKPIDRCVVEPQAIRDFISANFIELCLREIFIWRFMQTDPNWSNFLLGIHPQTNAPCLMLLDFGASRSYPKIFVDQYMRVIRSAYDGDVEKVLKYSREIGFLTGYESKIMENAHCESIMVLAELLTTRKPYNFAEQNVTRRIHKLIPVMLEHRLTSPPEEIYSLHRKLAGCYLIASKLKAVVSCGALFQEICDEYEFGEDKGDSINI